MATHGAQAVVTTINLSTPAFEDEGMIPQEYTCNSDNISPPLNWEAIPDGTKSLALTVEDPDAPGGTFVHWVLYDLPPDVQGLPENLPHDKAFAVGGTQGINSTDQMGYMGPCPPRGTHRYYFTLYALDAKLNLPAGETKDRLIEAMEGHIIGQGQVMGRYKAQ
jgi:Raf kinase inhibitor-like YbhB/YbcL family protein